MSFQLPKSLAFCLVILSLLLLSYHGTGLSISFEIPKKSLEITLDENISIVGLQLVDITNDNIPDYLIDTVMYEPTGSNLFAIDGKNFSRIWTADTPGHDIQILDNERILLFKMLDSHHANYHILNSATGSLVKTYKVTGGYCHPFNWNDDQNGDIYCFRGASADSGYTPSLLVINGSSLEVAWEKIFPDQQDSTYAKAININNDSYIDFVLHYGNSLLALDGRNGEFLWNVTITNPQRIKNIIVDENNSRFYIDSYNCLLQVFNTADGTTLWNTTMESSTGYCIEPSILRLINIQNTRYLLYANQSSHVTLFESDNGITFREFQIQKYHLDDIFYVDGRDSSDSYFIGVGYYFTPQLFGCSLTNGTILWELAFHHKISEGVFVSDLNIDTFIDLTFAVKNKIYSYSLTNQDITSILTTITSSHPTSYRPVDGFSFGIVLTLISIVIILRKKNNF